MRHNDDYIDNSSDAVSSGRSVKNFYVKIIVNANDGEMFQEAKITSILDLTITDTAKYPAIVLLLILNHNVDLRKLPFPGMSEKSCMRIVWDMKQIVWSKIEYEVDIYDCSALRRGSVEDSPSLISWRHYVIYFSNALWVEGALVLD